VVELEAAAFWSAVVLGEVVLLVEGF